MLRQLQTFFRQIRQRRYRLRAGFVIVCLLLLNMQQVIADHHPEAPSHRVESAQMLLSDLAHMPGMDSPELKAICQKHCHPDNTLTASFSPQPHAVPVVATLLPIVQEQQVCLWLRDTWQTPPVTGPPAEVRFCRFRE